MTDLSSFTVSVSVVDIRDSDYVYLPESLLSDSSDIFPTMGTLSICLYYFTMAATAFYPNFVIPAFSETFVNMTSVATFIIEYVSSIDSSSLI